MTMANVVIFCSLLLLQFVQSDQLNKRFGTKNPYRFIENDDTVVGPYPGCSPKKIHMTIRHGTRYPNDDTISLMQNKLSKLRDEIIKNHAESRGHLNKEQIQEFEKWIPIKIPLSDEKKLTLEGQDEMNKLGNRMHLRFNETIPLLYNADKIRFKFTPTERTEESAKHFATGIFGNIENVVFNKTQKDDPVLRFYKSCRKWRQEVKKNPKTYEELTSYIKTPDVEAVLKNVSIIFGYETDITYNVGKLFYVACAFETAWTKDYTSPWCHAFTESGMEVMEYAEDLKYYWVNGYGYEISEKLACTVMQDMLRFFNKKEDAQATFHFTHSGTILMMMAHLGIYRDSVQLTHTNRDPNRKWQTSLIDGFGSNIAFVYYKCNDGYKILLLHQEKPVRFPECPNQDLCPLETVINHRVNNLLVCDLAVICGLPTQHEEL